MLTGHADRSYRQLIALHGETLDRFEDAWLADAPQDIEALVPSVDPPSTWEREFSTSTEARGPWATLIHSNTRPLS